MLFNKLRGHLLQGSTNFATARRKGPHHLIINADDFVHGLLPIQRPRLKLQAGQLGDILLNQRVIKFRGLDTVRINHASINRRPLTIGALNPVGNHDVIVQVRVSRARVPVTKFCADHTRRRLNLTHTVAATAGHHNVLLQMTNHVLNGTLMRRLNALA